ncbi:unnamed protein product [Ilex paraguariensis]|uniref:Uncharacterized protein n=1 Tax=Ilex paraguariensis TaxID=185542 RepID=A0ABC8RLJ9_9AQUA
MAGCSSGIGLSHFVNLQNEVILRTPRSRNVMVVKVQVLNNVRNSTPILYKKIKRLFMVMKSGVVRTPVSNERDSSSLGKDIRILEINNEPKSHNGGGGGGGGNGGGGGGGGGGDDNEENEFGPILKFEEVIREIEARGATLPADMLEAAKSVGIRRLLLLRYLDLQGSVWPLGFAMRSCSMLRNRMLVDPSFLFKIGTEIVIDSCCATFAEVQKRGKDFWAEFELYAADLLVGVVVNVALVGMLAPYARIGQVSVSQGFLGHIQRAYGALPSSVFEAERPGCRFTVNQRIATYFYKGVLYGLVGFGCGIIGQGIANLIMTAKRFVEFSATPLKRVGQAAAPRTSSPRISKTSLSIKKSEEDIPVPPLLKSAALWGVFLAVSSNTRYQVINGLERLVEASPLAKQVPPVALVFTFGVRFANNIYGGMQFVDWARWSGVQ